MSVSDNFLPKFKMTQDLGHDLRNIKIAKMLSEGWFKGQLDYHMRKAGCITTIGGEEYYTGIQISQYVNDFNTKDTVGWHKKEALKLMGLGDSDIQQLIDVSRTDHVDNVYLRWIATDKMSKDKFLKYVDNMKIDLQHVDTIEIEYELERYKTSVYTTEASRIYNSRQSLFGDKMSWGVTQNNFDNQTWSNPNQFLPLPDIIYKDTKSIFGNSIKFFSGATDITSTIDKRLLYAVQSMIVYSGIDFMDRLSYSKIGEATYNVRRSTSLTTYTTEEFKSAIGKEVYSARIKTAFKEDKDGVHWKRYSAFYPQIDGGKGGNKISIPREDQWREDRNPLRGQKPRIWSDAQDDSFYMTTAFWDYTGYTTRQTGVLASFNRVIVDGSDYFLFRSSGNADIGAYIKVSEFRKLSMKDIGYYLSNYFDIKVDQSSGGGFFSGFIGFIAGMLGSLFNIFFDVFEMILPLKLSLQIFTLVVNKLFDSHMTEKDVMKIGLQLALVVVGVVLSPFTLGQSITASIVLSLAIAGSSAIDEKKKNEEIADLKKKLEEQRKEDQKKKKEEDRQKETSNNSDQNKSRDEFNAFLKDPLFKIEQEKKQMKGNLELQFKLL